MALAMLIFSACAQSPSNPAGHVSLSGSPMASPTTSPMGKPGSGPVSTSSPYVDLPLSSVAFTCRLPIYRNSNQGSTIQDSFVSFPSGTVMVDPNGKNGLYFDRAYSRWVPMDREAISPDGARYATVEMGSQPGNLLIHIVDVPTGNDHAIQVAATKDFGSAQPIVFDYAPEGIYLIQAFEHIWPGVWLFDPGTGSLRKVADVETPEVIGPAGALWFGQVNAADPNPFSSRSSAGIFPNEVDRFDLRSGARTQWLYRPGISLQVIGIDVSGRPVIQIHVPGTDPGIGSMGFFDHAQSELLLAVSSTSQRSIYKGGLVETLRAPIADSHGVWFGSDQGIYLYSDAGGLQKVSNQPGFPGNGCF